MQARENRAEEAPGSGFEFDYDHNLLRVEGAQIRLSPHEADILHILLRNRGRATPIASLIKQVYGSSAPASASISLRGSVHSLRKKLGDTGIRIKAAMGVGYEIDADALPELNKRLSDKILVALNMAKAAGEDAIAQSLQAAYDKAEAHRRAWLADPKNQSPHGGAQLDTSRKAVA